MQTSFATIVRIGIRPGAFDVSSREGRRRAGEPPA
jgi:hypothetical protein